MGLIFGLTFVVQDQIKLDQTKVSKRGLSDK